MSIRTRPAALSARGGRIVAWCVAASSALPLLACFPAPLTDWPNHIARVWIGVRLLRHDPFWMRFYEINPRLVPNLALDLGVGALNFLGLNVDAAAAAFLVLTLGAFVFGFCRLARAMDADDWTKPMIGAALFLTGPLMYGLVNYMLGIGVALGLLGAWADRASRPWRQWILAIVAVIVLFPIHLLAAAVFVAVAGCMDIWRWRVEWRRGVSALTRASSSLAAGAIFFGLLLASPMAGEGLPQADGSNLWFPGHGQILATLWWKGGIFVTLFADHATIAAAAATFLCIFVVIACAAMPRASNIYRADDARGGAWLAVAALLIVVLLSPSAIGDGSLFDYRIALAPILLAAALLKTDALRPRPRRIAGLAIAAMCLVRSVSFAADFHGQDRVFRFVERESAKIPPGGIVLTAHGLDDGDIPQRTWWSPPQEHAASRAVFANQFVPTIFADASQQPVVLKSAFEELRRGLWLASANQVSIFAKTVAPLCAGAEAWPGRVSVFVAYAGRFANGPNDADTDTTGTDKTGKFQTGGDRIGADKIDSDRIGAGRWAFLDACAISPGKK